MIKEEGGKALVLPGSRKDAPKKQVLECRQAALTLDTFHLLFPHLEAVSLHTAATGRTYLLPGPVLTSSKATSTF